MSATQAKNSAPTSAQKKSADTKCVQTTKGWVCALCFPLGHASRALERVMNLAELRAHANGNHYASLGQHEWDNYVKNSVYFEAQFRNHSSLGLNNGVIHGPTTIVSQKSPANQVGLLKRPYVKKATPATTESAFDLMETMINFNQTANDNDDATNYAFPTTALSKAGPFSDTYAHLQFDMASQNESEIISSPNTPSRKKNFTPKNPLRQRLSENPSFESAVSVHGLAKVQAAGNIGLQRYLDRQARGLPRTSNIPLQLGSTPRNGTMDLSLTAANYAAAGMPNIHTDKATRRTKKIYHRHQGSTSLGATQVARNNTSPLTNTATTNASLNIFGVPAAIYGQAPGAAYESHTYKSIYADAPSQEQLPLPDLSLPGLSFADQPLNNTGLNDIYGSFDFDAYMADSNCAFDSDSAVENTTPQQNTNSVNDFFTWAGIPNQNVAPLNNTEKIGADFFTTANTANTQSSEIDAMLHYGNFSSPQDNNHNFTIFKADSLEYGPAGVQVLKDAEAIISARSSSSGARSTASSATNTSAPDTKTLPSTVAPDTPATPLSLQELEAANKALTEELAFQKGLHQADVRRRKLEAKKAIQRREDEARLKKKTDARYKRLIDQRKANQVLTKQLADEKESNDDLRMLLAQEKTSRQEDKQRHNAEFKAQTELVVKANAAISRQTSVENKQKKQIAQKKTQVAAAATTNKEVEAMLAPAIQKKAQVVADTTNKKAEAMRAPVIQKKTQVVADTTNQKAEAVRAPAIQKKAQVVADTTTTAEVETMRAPPIQKFTNDRKKFLATTAAREAQVMRGPFIQKAAIDRRKILTAKKPVASIQTPEKLAAKKPVASIQAPEKLVSAYDKGRKTTHPSNVSTAANPPRPTTSRKRPASDILAIPALTREHVIKKARTTVAGDAPRKSVPDGNGKFHWDRKFDCSGKLTGEARKEAEVKENAERLRIMNEYTENKVSGEAPVIQGHLIDPKRFNDKGRF
ncbi:hypothetical protein ACHAPC_004347 [Botrytis cinerea]